MTGKSYTFTHAISRTPCKAIVDGLRAVDTGTPDYERFLEHHADYVDALRSTGAKVEVLPADEAFPDSVFIEDAALCLAEVAIKMRPGAASRLGEVETIAPVLAKYYPQVFEIDAPASIEGGDILATEREILVGTSARTNSEGIAALSNIVGDWGYKVREVETPKGVLHFKTDCSMLDENTILTTKLLSASGCFDGYQVIHPADGEEACANAIRFNNLVIMPAGYPRTAEILDKAGHEVVEIGNSEAAKLDGGMSCLSLRFSPPQSV